MLDKTPMQTLAERARAVLPAGGFGNFDPSVFIREGRGARVWDEDGNEYVDYLIGSGPMLLGHGHPEVLEVVVEQLPKGMTFFANNAAAVELAEEICRAVACAEQVRFLSSGGEADMYAMRLARAYTGRDKILKFEGGYHGMSAEAQMSLAPSRLVNFPQALPDSAGIPESVRGEMLIAPFNDPDYLESLLKEHGTDVAGIIVEPLQRIIPPAPGFLQAVRDLCDRYGIVLIFDEVVTGFRFAYGGAQEAYGVTPDLCTLGKIIGGGFPLAAVAGRKDIMDHFDKTIVGADRWLMMLGTLSGNPVAAVAGLKTMEILRRDGAYDTLRAHGERLQKMFSSHLDAADVAHRIVGHPTLFDIVFTDRDIRTYRDVLAADAKKGAAFNAVLRENGVFKSPGKLYPCLALTEADFELTETAILTAATAIA
ncbi:aminotransferase class III-fold pyridoxal phosphate-dependent enzyme [Defluviimonas sp. WL0050]|uniref:Aminotransferase class III-fold pyridoxal phosphate-dependent enzyme n=1 Tax=Albidovulum litorale TaxID=2984134 RepID=A0ABT2ZHS8_9RHOB|nr:aminotransferase class III-fold pyridoxal phosphate-dependent enzyme [Defluviimonas sp. WL0050]MCV2870690.1 aminotransferase class III-fold pyridoxal phosphate-dependent enzyme [Defluviimonas sp. WL0050]